MSNCSGSVQAILETPQTAEPELLAPWITRVNLMMLWFLSGGNLIPDEKMRTLAWYLGIAF